MILELHSTVDPTRGSSIPRSRCPARWMNCMYTIDCMVIHTPCIRRVPRIHSNNGGVKSSPNSPESLCPSSTHATVAPHSLALALLSTPLSLSRKTVSAMSRALSTYPHPVTWQQPGHTRSDAPTTMIWTHRICVPKPRPLHQGAPPSKTLSRRVHHAWCAHRRPPH